MNLALVVPVWNDADGLAALLAPARAMGCFDHVVVVDDGSERTIDLDGGQLFATLPEADITLLRNATPQGAGQARNRALEVLCTSHMVFFDSDDLFTREFVALWRDLEGQAFDFCIYKHNDSRVSERGGWGQMAQDNALWRLAGCASGALQQVGSGAAAYLAETANYPWNKIYRTGFLRDHGLRCSEIPVHNDIALHWRSFVHGRDILASDRVAVTHFVHSGGARLTNRRGVERLKVFGALEQVASEIKAGEIGARGDLMLALLRFSSGLVEWIRANIPASIAPKLDRAAAGFFRRHLDRRAFMRLCRSDPVLALRLNLLMARGQI